MKQVLIALLLCTLWLGGCATPQQQLAPCDQYGTLCGNKIKINQW